MMENIILKHLGIIDKSNTWIQTSLQGNKAKTSYRHMVNFRRKLNKKKFAIEGNPAAAMYGESQAGKSYLVSALLSEDGKPFKVISNDGIEYDFKNNINPRGNEMESTSIITRFSTKQKWISSSYPVIAKLLSPTDIILLICEAYYNNLDVNNALTFEYINEKISSFEVIYSNKKECQKLIIEDDVFNMEEYFQDNFSKLKYINILSANFFDKISGLVTKIPPEDWKDVFSLLWNFNAQLTALFNDLILQYKQLNFIDTIYLPIDAVLRSKGTLLDVDRIDEIYGAYNGEEKEYSANTPVLYLNQEGVEKKQIFSKPYLCALTAELIFVLPESLKLAKPFLAQTDLLDFPGCRAYEATKEDAIPNKSLAVLLRRGRVDYLFNKYSTSEKINVLLFCQNQKMAKQNIVSKKLNYWIGNVMGKTPEERSNFKSPISPLFIISTWFNKDMEYDSQSDKPNQKQSFNEKWQQRFIKVLKNEIIKVHEYNWFENWTVNNRYFQNIYLLRDFEKSGENVQNSSNLYKGFNDYNLDRKELVEIKPDEYPDFRLNLRQSFIEYDFVKQHFSNPAESWDEAASINKDGTKLIIEKLTIAANNINSARMAKMQAEINEINKQIYEELIKYFHSNDKSEELQKAKNIAGDIQFRLATAFSADNIKNYGQLMKELMINESLVINLYRKKVNDLEHRDLVNIDIYSSYLIDVPVEDGDTPEKYFERLCLRYEKTTEERKEEFRVQLKSLGIDLEQLINGSFGLIKNNAQQLAELLIEYWFEHISMNDKYIIQKILAQDSSLDNLKEMFQKLFKKIGITNRIAENIRHYIGRTNKTDLPFELIADISAEMLNKFIETVGFEYLDESEINDLHNANEKNNLGLNLNNNTKTIENSVEELFNKVEKHTEILSTKPEEIKSLPSYRNYLAWSNLLKVGFVSVCAIPNYDVTANANLGKIIEECNALNT